MQCGTVEGDQVFHRHVNVLTKGFGFRLPSELPANLPRRTECEEVLKKQKFFWLGGSICPSSAVRTADPQSSLSLQGGGSARRP